MTQHPKARRVVARLSTVLTVVSLIVSLSVLATLAFGWKFVPVLSGSMRPTLSAGDAAVARPVSPDKLRVGDVVVARAGGDDQPLVIHRVVQLARTPAGVSALTKGDANAVADPWRTEFGNRKVLRQQTVIPGFGVIVRQIAQFDTPARLVQSAVIFCSVGGLVALWAPRNRRSASTSAASTPGSVAG